MDTGVAEEWNDIVKTISKSKLPISDRNGLMKKIHKFLNKHAADLVFEKHLNPKIFDKLWPDVPLLDTDEKVINYIEKIAKLFGLPLWKATG